MGIPVPTKKQENKDKFGQNTEDKLDEWEKNQVKKLFREGDKDKNGLTKEELKRVFARLLEDECIIGKVPKSAGVDQLFEAWNTNKDGKVSWVEFRDGLNRWEWRLTERDKLNEKVEQFFKMAYKCKMQGNDKDSKEYAARALRLQGSLTKTKPIEVEVKKEAAVPKRGDFFNVKMHREAQDKTLSFKFVKQ